MNTSHFIISHPEILGGKPVFKGSRVPISNLIEYLEAGYTIDDFLEGFPTVKKKQVKQVLDLLLTGILQDDKTKTTARRTLRHKVKTIV